MSEMEARLRIRIDGRDEFSNLFNQAGASAAKFQSIAGQAFRQTGRELLSMGSHAASAIKSLSGLNKVFDFTGNIQSALDLDDAIAKMASTAGEFDPKNIRELKKEILEASSASNQFAESINAAYREYVGKTGNLPSAGTVKTWGRVATATNSEVSDVASIAVEMSKMGITSEADQKSAFSILAKQADAGSVEIRDIARSPAGQRIISDAAAAGLTGIEGFREAGALAQVGRKTAGSTARTATGMQNTWADMRKQSDRINDMGIKTSGRDPIEILKDLIRKTGGDIKQLERHGKQGVFGEQALHVVQGMIADYKTHGGKFADFDDYRNKTSDTSVIDNKFAQNVATAREQQKAAEVAAQNQLAKKSEEIAASLAKITAFGSKVEGFIVDHPVAALGVGAGGLAAKNILGSMLFGGGGGGLFGKLVTGGKGMPVFVTNMGVGGMGGGGNPVADAAKGAGGSLFGRAITGITGIGAGASAGLAAGLLASGAVLYYGSKKADESRQKLFAGDEQAERDRQARRASLVQRHGGMTAVTGGNAILGKDGEVVIQHLAVTIHGDEATVGTGTRSHKTMVKRHVGHP